MDELGHSPVSGEQNAGGVNLETGAPDAVGVTGATSAVGGSSADGILRKIAEAHELLDARAEKYTQYHREFQPDARDAAYQSCRFAERRIGAFIGGLKAAGLLGDGRPKRGTKIGGQTAPISLAALGITRSQSRVWQRWARMSDEAFLAMLDNERARPIIAPGRSPQAHHIHSVALSSISISNRVRVLRPDKVDELAESMRERGLINPITVRQVEDGKYPLIAGHHRYQGARPATLITISTRGAPSATWRPTKGAGQGQETGQAVIFSLAAMSTRWFDTLPADLQSMVLATAQEIRIEVNPWEVDFLARERRSWVEKGGDINILATDRPWCFQQKMRSISTARRCSSNGRLAAAKTVMSGIRI